MAAPVSRPAGETEGLPLDKVVVHPLVLLSVVDHYSRVAKDTSKRVVGVLLGETYKGTLDVTNSFAVPFEEDEKDSSIWFLDHNYLENMFSMFKRVNAKEHVVGWYSSGPKIRESDADINELFRSYCQHPVFVVVDVKPAELGIPTKAYLAVEEVKPDGTQKAQTTFAHVTSEVGASEPEEIGVEHLLRDVRDATVSTLAVEVGQKLGSLKGLHSRLREIQSYLGEVAAGKLPVKHDIMYQLQDVFNLLPNLNVDDLVRAFAEETNDGMMATYLASLIRAVVALHNLIANRAQNRQWEKDEGEKQAKEAAARKDKDKKGAKADKADGEKENAAGAENKDAPMGDA